MENFGVELSGKGWFCDMRITSDEAAALAAVIQRDLDAVAALEAHASRFPDADLTREQIDSLGFTLHNIYNALENSFTQISLTFENHVKDRARWHRELMEKMFLDVPPLRPPVLTAECRALVADLIGFRHLFRHAYEFSLDAQKVLALWHRWKVDGGRIKDSLGWFLTEVKRQT